MGRWDRNQCWAEQYIKVFIEFASSCYFLYFPCEKSAATIGPMKPTFLLLVALAMCQPLFAAETHHKAHSKHVAASAPPEASPKSFSVKGADGTVKTYTLEIPSTLPAAKPGQPETKVTQQSATLAALAWAPTFYGSKANAVDAATFESSPTSYYLVHLTGEIGGTRQPFFAAVLSNGQLVRPTETLAVQKSAPKREHSRKAAKK
jgi:hypothetical protein